MQQPDFVIVVIKERCIAGASATMKVTKEENHLSLTRLQSPLCHNVAQNSGCYDECIKNVDLSIRWSFKRDPVPFHHISIRRSESRSQDERTTCSSPDCRSYPESKLTSQRSSPGAVLQKIMTAMDAGNLTASRSIRRLFSRMES